MGGAPMEDGAVAVVGISSLVMFEVDTAVEFRAVGALMFIGKSVVYWLGLYIITNFSRRTTKGNFLKIGQTWFWQQILSESRFTSF